MLLTIRLMTVKGLVPPSHFSSLTTVRISPAAPGMSPG